eukprot:g11296.t1
MRRESAGGGGGRRMSSMMGNQHDVTEECKIFKNTSNITIKQAQKDHDCYWKSHNKECPHEIIYDFVQKVHLTAIKMELLGCDTVNDDVSYNPKCVCVSYTQAADLDASGAGNWLPVKRAFCPQEAEELEITWICEESARFWKVEFQLAWPNAACVIVKQCKLLAEDPGGRPRNTDLRVMSREQGSQLARMAQEFDMEKNLSPELIEVRALAKKHGVSVDDAEMLRKRFDQFDADKSGVIDKEEFKGVLAAFMGNRNTITPERFDSYWRDVDSDNSGEVDFEEFLSWYQNTVKQNGLTPEGFYATFGVQRLGRIAAANEG